MKLLKHQVLDLQDKFDYFILMQLKSGELRVEDFQAPPQSLGGPDVTREEVDEAEASERLKTQLQDFAASSKLWDLGNRSVLYRESTSGSGLGKRWLSRLQELNASFSS